MHKLGVIVEFVEKKKSAGGFIEDRKI